MPQLLKPYNPWYMGIEAAVAAAVAANALQPEGLSLGAAATVAVVIGSWNYYVQKNYAVPDVLIERAEALKFNNNYNKDLKLIGSPALAMIQAGIQEDAWLKKTENDAYKNF